MNEKNKQLNLVVGLFVLLLCTALYAWGGIEYKWLRRYLAPIVCCGYMYYRSKDWRVLLQIPLQWITLSMGYGAVAMWEKIFRRGIYGSLNAITANTYNIINKQWLLLGLHLIILISAYIIMGVFNPTSARAEETFLGLLLFSMPILSVRGKNDKY